MNYADCAGLLLSRDNYLLVTHKRPDGDTLGSAAALCHALRRLGKTAYLFPNTEVTENYLPLVEELYAPAGFTSEHHISVDVAEMSMAALDYTGDIFLKIDHHIPRGDMGQYQLIHPECAACGEIVLQLIESMGLVPDRDEANMLYTAVSTDTGCFRYANTVGDTFRAAGHLVDLGAELPRLNKLYFRTKTRARLSLEGMVYSTLRSERDNAINIAVITLDMLERSSVVENDLDDLANLAGQVAGNRVAITVREICREPERSKVSVRTDGSVNASEVCARFGGGGHRMAAGCEFSLSPEQTAQAVLNAVEEVWP